MSITMFIFMWDKRKMVGATSFFVQPDAQNNTIFGQYWTQYRMGLLRRHFEHMHAFRETPSITSALPLSLGWVKLKVV